MRLYAASVAALAAGYVLAIVALVGEAWGWW